jgi:hypothetical protein
LTQSAFKKDIQKSDELVETLMIFMGSTCAKQLDNGIYLLQTPIQSMATLSISSISSTYVLEKPEIPYMHITSPIRRIIDIVNMAQIIITLKIETPWFSLELQQQIDNVKENLLKINKTTKSIKKVQSQCRLYHLFKHQPPNKIYTGILFDKRETKTPEIYSYSVYLTEYKFTTTIKTREPKEPGKEYPFYLYLFHDATTLKQKIKLQIAGLC